MFVTFSGLVAAPPVRPGQGQVVGLPCFKAVVDLFDTRGTRAGKFTGYDVSPGVVAFTEHACRVKRDNLDGDYRCGASRLSMVSHIPGMKCEGLFFEIGATKKRLS
jgi:hypothetical protein